MHKSFDFQRVFKKPGYNKFVYTTYSTRLSIGCVTMRRGIEAAHISALRCFMKRTPGDLLQGGLNEGYDNFLLVLICDISDLCNFVSGKHETEVCRTSANYMNLCLKFGPGKECGCWEEGSRQKSQNNISPVPDGEKSNPDRTKSEFKTICRHEKCTSFSAVHFWEKTLRSIAKTYCARS